MGGKVKLEVGMLRDAGVALIKEQLAFKTTLDANIVRYLQLAQTTLERGPTKPWFLISEDTFTSTVADEERISLPLDFLQEVEDGAFRYRPDNWPDDEEVELVKDEYDVLKRNFVDNEAGPPEAYALIGNYFRIFPTPDDVYNIRLIYYKKGVTLDTNVENEWLREIPLLLLGTAGNMMTTPVRDKEAKTTFTDWVNVGLKLLHGHDTSRDMANRVMAVGGPAV